MNIAVPTRLLGGRFARSAGCVFYVTSSDVEIAGCRIDGGGQGAGYDINQKLIYVQGAKGSPLARVNIHDNVLYGSRGDSIWIEWCVGSKVHHNTISTYLYSGIMAISCVGCNFDNNNISDGMLASGNVDIYGIACTDLTNILADRTQYCTINGNRVSTVDWEGIDTHGGLGMTIVGNIITGCPRGIALVVGNTSRNAAPEDCTVSGNTIDSTGLRKALREGIYLGGKVGAQANANITGNTILNYNGNELFTDNWNRGATFIGGNSSPQIPWTDLVLNSTFVPHSTYKPQYMMDDNVVYLRGGVYGANGSTQQPSMAVAVLPVACRPTQLCWVTGVKSARSDGGGGTGVVQVDTNGTLTLAYRSGATTLGDAWPITGSYRII